MHLWLTKVIILTSLLAGSLLCGLLPFKLQTYLNRRDGLGESSFVAAVKSVVNCFAGGVFLGTTFLELIPEVSEGFEEVFTQTNRTVEYPLGEFTVMVGFFFILLIEQLVVSMMNRRKVHLAECADQPNTCSHGDVEVLYSSQKKSYGTVPTEFKQDSNLLPKSQLTEPCETEKLVISVESNERGTNITEVEDMDVHSLRTFVLLLALSVHTVFEGLAIGLKDEAAELWSLFAAVLLHKSVISFSLGTQLLENCQSKVKAFLFLLIFCVMSPVGVFIGILISESAQGNLSLTITSTVLQAIATGTFVHVTFFEILGRELSEKKKILNIATTILGFACVALITMLE